MFDYGTMTMAGSIPEALAALGENPAARVICGGTDVLLHVRDGKLSACPLVCVRDIPELRGVRLEEDGTLVIGPSTSFDELTRDPLIGRHVPLLSCAAGEVGGPQVRRMATVGGNVCSGLPSGDIAPGLFVLEAELELEGPSGRRRVGIRDFYLSAGKVALQAGELLTALRIARKNYAGFFGCYIKSAQRNAMDIATLSCAALVKLDADRTHIGEARFALGVAAPVPLRLGRAEAAAKGGRLTQELTARVAAAALADAQPRDSWRASKQLRLQLARELTARALRAAAHDAGGVFDV